MPGEGVRRTPAGKAENVTVGVKTGRRAEAAEPVPEAESEDEADEAKAEAAAVVERDAAGASAEGDWGG